MMNPSPLAPGFRFHPTDEELVLFYLKRKLLSRSFPVDAIPEVDLYRSEPWELPEKSQIRGGDREWYFFCRLDRNRSRANRATTRGYWKTTGKDRAVRSGAGREVGTKKTLMFHVGRAPRGERTNWVMHEYRIMAGEIGCGGIDQDAYVVCRIFQKSGPGPQKGAQYGALVVEEEWAHDDNTMTLREEGASSPPVDLGEEQVAQLEDCEQKRQSLKISDEFASCSQESDDKQDAVFRPVCPVDMHGEARDEPVQNNVTFGKSSGSVVLSCNAPGTPDDKYLEVDDLAASLDGVYAAEGPVSLTYGLCIDMGRQCDDNMDHFSSLADLHGVEEFFDASDDTTADDEKFLKDILNIRADEYTCGEQVDEEIVYFDAPMLHPTSEHVRLVEENDFVDAIVTGSAPDPMDELVAYFGATEDRMEGPYSAHLEREGAGTASAVGHSISDEVDDSKPSGKSCRSTNDPKEETGASSSINLPFISDLSTAQNRDGLAANDAPFKKCKDNTLEGHLASMLGSISCPPALAAEMSKSLRPGATSQAFTSIHVTAGIIHIESFFVDMNGIHTSAPKTRDADILLSYSTRGIDGHNNLLTVAEKTDLGSVMLMDSNGLGFLLACFSIAFLALIFKVGM